MKQEFLLNGTNGYDIPCLEWTSPNEQGVLLCLHGFAGDKNSSVIHSVADVMGKHSVRVLTFDWPAHGASPADESFLTIENCLNDLETVVTYIKETNGKHINLLATSFGGFLALHFLLRHPTLFSKVVLRSPALQMPDTYHTFLSPEDRIILDNGGTVNMGFERIMHLGKSFSEDLFAHRLPLEQFGTLSNCMIIQGDRDDVVSPEDSFRFAEEHGCMLCRIPGADHRYKNEGDLETILSSAEAFLCE